MIEKKYIIDELDVFGGNKIIAYNPDCPDIETPVVDRFELNVIRVDETGSISWRVSVKNPSSLDNYFTALNRSSRYSRLIDFGGNSYRLNTRTGEATRMEKIYR